MKKRVRVGKTRIQYVRYVLRQDGSEGWSVAQVRDVISGWAGEVIGDIAERVAGRVVLFGKRIGDMNGLTFISYAIDHTDKSTYG